MGGSSRSWAGPGDGPGEFSRLEDLYLCGNDSIVVNEFRRLSIFSPDGEFSRTVPLPTAPEGGSVRVMGVDGECSRVLTQEGAFELPPVGTVGPVMLALRWRSLDDGIEVEDVADVRRFVAWHRPLEGGGTALAIIPWAAQDVWAVHQQHLYLGSSDRPEIRVYTPSASCGLPVPSQSQAVLRQSAGGRPRQSLEAGAWATFQLRLTSACLRWGKAILRVWQRMNWTLSTSVCIKSIAVVRQVPRRVLVIRETSGPKEERPQRSS